jgi:hypothetical protein
VPLGTILFYLFPEAGREERRKRKGRSRGGKGRKKEEGMAREGRKGCEYFFWEKVPS